MALPSLFKRGFDKALWSRMGWGILLFLFILNFSSSHLNLIGDPTSAWSQPDIAKRRARIRFNGFQFLSYGIPFNFNVSNKQALTIKEVCIWCRSLTINVKLSFEMKQDFLHPHQRIFFYHYPASQK